MSARQQHQVPRGVRVLQGLSVPGPVQIHRYVGVSYAPSEGGGWSLATNYRCMELVWKNYYFSSLLTFPLSPPPPLLPPFLLPPSLPPPPSSGLPVCCVRSVQLGTLVLHGVQCHQWSATPPCFFHRLLYCHDHLPSCHSAGEAWDARM